MKSDPMRRIWLFTLGVVVGLTISSHESRAQCNQMPITTLVINTSAESQSAWLHLQCTSDFKTHEDARNAGIALRTLVYDVPLELTGTFSQSAKDTWKREHCQQDLATSNYASSYQALIKWVSPEAYRSWVDCVRLSSYGVTCWFEEPSPADVKSLTLRTRWTPLPGDAGAKPTVVDSVTICAKTVSKNSQVPFSRNANLAAGPSVALFRMPAGASVTAVVNTTRGSCVAFAPQAGQVWDTVYDDADPVTGQSYRQQVTYQKNDHYTQPPKPRGEGHEIIINHDAPGPVTTAQCEVLPGGGGGWTHQEACSVAGNRVHWEGWSNSGDPATIRFDLRYKMPRRTCVKNCDEKCQ